ncbi:MAG: ribosome recycling factor [Anaerolineae bacterium]|nr:ribosome recycling factor [Anaerolineae bacterium]MDW8171742.1 ribosome recycling factor [Anaerolineae bacterium]
MIEDIISSAREKMGATLHVLEEDLQGMRSNRASTALVDRLRVDYYGMETELRQLANISTPDALTIMIRPYDKGATKAIEKAIQEANIGVNPSVDGEVIRLVMPPLTKERRQDLVKHLHKRLEDARIAIRNIRRHANDEIKEYEKEKMVSEDDAKRGQDKVQQMTDEHIKKIDEVGKAKEKDILEV